MSSPKNLYVFPGQNSNAAAVVTLDITGNTLSVNASGELAVLGTRKGFAFVELDDPTKVDF